jgi:uncharacterized OB-fold protein
MTAMNNTLDVTRPLPVDRTIARPFWDATREKKVLIQYDAEVGKYQFYPRPTSIFTGRTKHLEWREVAGKGKVFTYTIARRARPPFREHEPFFVAMVTLDEEVNIMANIVNCTEEEMKVGLRVKPYWTPLSDGRNLLLFEPDKG